MKKIIRHGEVILKPSELPKEAKKIQTAEKYIVAHSEIGHHHILETMERTNAFEIYSYNGETYFKLNSPAKLWHKKTGQDVHKPHIIAPDIYKVVIKEQFDYFTKKMEQVRD